MDFYISREEARELCIAKALDAGADEDTANAIRDSAMSAYEDLAHDEEQFEDMIDAVIQGHLMP